MVTQRELIEMEEDDEECEQEQEKEKESQRVRTFRKQAGAFFSFSLTAR